jgi:hypothetical protein
MVAAGVAVSFACGSGSSLGPKAPVSGGVAKSAIDAGADTSRCDYHGRTDREVTETTGPGAMVPNVRRVYAIVGEGEDARRVLICREIDTNLDGVKDVVRTYSNKGESVAEQADTDYDGKIDTWITFSRGRIAKMQVDSDRSGTPDQTQHYISGKLSRIERDTNGNDKSDVWEIYEEGRLQRMGVDLDHDGHVDRWDRDQVVVRAAEEKELEEERREAREKEEREQELADGGVTDARVSARNR